jgi:hypothetical protein
MSADERRERVIESIVEQFRLLLESRYPQILKAATDTFQDDTDAADPTCKVNALVEWDAMAPSTKIAVRLTWSAKFKDESDDIVDFEQTALPLDEEGKA